MMATTEVNLLREILREPLVVLPHKLAQKNFTYLQERGYCEIEVSKGTEKWTCTITDSGIERFFDLMDERNNRVRPNPKSRK